MVLYSRPLQDLLSPRELIAPHMTSTWLFVTICSSEALTRALSYPNAPQAVIRRVAGNRCRDIAGLFAEWSAALEFPEYFGHNWDAFEECINDLPDWLPSSRYVIVVSNADRLFADCSVAERKRFANTLFEILGAAAERYRDRDADDQPHESAEFVVILQSDVTDRPRLLDLAADRIFEVCDIGTLSHLLAT